MKLTPTLTGLNLTYSGGWSSGRPLSLNFKVKSLLWRCMNSQKVLELIVIFRWEFENSDWDLEVIRTYILVKYFGRLGECEEMVSVVGGAGGYLTECGLPLSISENFLYFGNNWVSYLATLVLIQKCFDTKIARKNIYAFISYLRIPSSFLQFHRFLFVKN